MKCRIALIQLLVEGGEPKRNLERAESYVRAAAKNGADIILLPETLDLGWTHPSVLSESEPIPGPRSNMIASWASELNVFICAGLTETENSKIYNSAVFFNNQGELILKYRKINLLVGVEYPDFYCPGDVLKVVETPWGKIGVNICADNYENALCIGSTLGRMGAGLILSPSSWTVDFSISENADPYDEKWIKPYSALANTYGLIIVGATSVGYIVGGPYEGKKMVGCSLAVGPNGVLTQGLFNEFSTDIEILTVEVPSIERVGTQLGKFI
jgi:predicted amidohydrolase